MFGYDWRREQGRQWGGEYVDTLNYYGITLSPYFAMSCYKSGAGSRVSARSLSTELLSEIASSKQQRAQAHTGIKVTYKRRGGETSHDPGQYAIARQQDRVLSSF